MCPALLWGKISSGGGGREWGFAPFGLGHKKNDMQCIKVTTLNQDLTEFQSIPE
jgi:hypothetical protein